ncbi:MAG: hypothetical protein ACR2P0_12095 [Acidimicrobiales bacterium]
MVTPTVGVLNEGPLHASLKEWYRRPGDRVEQPLDGFVIDLVRGDTLIEIQTRGFSAMRKKLDHLLDRYPIRVVHPIAAEKWVVKLDPETGEVSRRKSPKRGIPADVFGELVSFPSLVSHPNFTLELVMIREDEVRRADTKKGWRRGGWVVDHRELVEVVDHLILDSPVALGELLPPGLPQVFTTADLATALGRTRHVAQDVAYCLKTADAIHQIARDRDGIHYRFGRPDGE